MPEWKGCFCQTIPTLIVEVLSTSSKSEIERDTRDKRLLYQSMGVKEYIIVGQDGIIIVFRLNEDKHYESEIYTLGVSEGIVFNSKYLDEVSLNIDEIY